MIKLLEIKDHGLWWKTEDHLFPKSDFTEEEARKLTTDLPAAFGYGHRMVSLGDTSLYVYMAGHSVKLPYDKEHKSTIRTNKKDEICGFYIWKRAI